MMNGDRADMLAGELDRLFLAYDARFGAGDVTKRGEGFLLAVKGQPYEIVRQAVDDFIAGTVARKAGTRGKLPTSDEFGGHIRELVANKPRNAAGETTVYAPPFGPLWGVKLYDRLLAGPDQHIPLASKFMQSMIDKGGEIGERYRLDHQASVGFKSVTVMFELAADGKGSHVETSLLPMAEAMEPVPVTERKTLKPGTFGAWRDEHALRGWPWLPDPGNQKVVYFPKGGPMLLPSFENMLSKIERAKPKA